MLTIKRGCSYRIINRALEFEGRPLLGLLQPDADDCAICIDRNQLMASLDASPGGIIVYNQQADAVALIDGLELPRSQVYIEIAQDTKGVLGLYAYRKTDGGRETLELIYQ